MRGKYSNGIVYGMMMIGMMVKVPMVPVHGWLPVVHTEATTQGSVILAAVVMKYGYYGVYRMMEMMPDETEKWRGVGMVVCGVGVIVGSVSSVSVVDMKKIVAYASIYHMNVSMMGMWSGELGGVSGSIMASYGHSVISAGMFIMVGKVYSEAGSRNIMGVKGIGEYGPIMRGMVMMMIVSNNSIPMTMGFSGESVMMIGMWKGEEYGVVIGGMSVVMVVGTGVNFWMMGRIVNVGDGKVERAKDMSRAEVMVMMPIGVMNIVLGVKPSMIMEGIGINAGIMSV